MNQTVAIENVSRETLHLARGLYQEKFDIFESYLDELLWWNKKVNLVSRDVSRETLREHIVHSLIPIPMGLLSGIKDWVDAGTGGGFPGIPLAVIETEKQWTLNDIVGKKIAAVKQIIHKLNLVNAHGETDSIGDIRLLPGAGIITKHAFSIHDLMGLIEGKTWQNVIMYKGANEAEQEIQRVQISLKGAVYRFDFGGDEPFYEGKGIVTLERIEE